jgi:hypothetical protein
MKLLLLLFFVFENKITPLPDSVSVDSTLQPAHSITLESGFGSNTVFFGRMAPQKLPYSLTSVTFSHKKGFYAAGSFFHAFDDSGLNNISDLSLGYNFNFSDRIDGSVSYTKFFINPGSLLVQSTTSNLADAFLSLDWSYLYTSVGVMKIFGATNDVFFIISNSRYFEKERLLGIKGTFALEPAISFIAGTQNFSTTYTENYESITGVKPNSPIGAGGPGKPGGGGTFGGSSATTINSTTPGFGALCYEFNLPFTYTLKNFSVEPAWKYVIPVNVSEGDASAAQSVWTLSLYYTLKSKKNK